MDSKSLSFFDSLARWWHLSTAEASEQPAPMTYEEVMRHAPQRRISGIYADALDDEDSSGDEGDCPDVVTYTDDPSVDHVLGLHKGIVRDGVPEAKDSH